MVYYALFHLGCSCSLNSPFYIMKIVWRDDDGICGVYSHCVCLHSTPSTDINHFNRNQEPRTHQMCLFSLVQENGRTVDVLLYTRHGVPQMKWLKYAQHEQHWNCLQLILPRAELKFLNLFRFTIARFR